MAEVSATGIVLRRKDSGESDRRLTILTKELGKIDAIAKGARKAASRLAGVSEPLSVATFSLASGKRNAFITQAQPTSAFRRLRSDYDRLSFSLALVELFAAVLPYEEPNEAAFELLAQSLVELETTLKPIVVSVWSQARLLNLSGVLPQFESCVICDTPSRLSEALLSPMAGGNLCEDHARTHSDRFAVRHEVLIGLSRIAQRSEPPENLKFSDECLSALMPFWRHFVDYALPANDALTRYLHEERLTSSAEI